MSHQETFTHNGYTIRLTPDEFGDTPAQLSDTTERFLVGFHRQFTVHYADESDGRYADDAPVIKSKDDAFWYLPKDAILKHLIEEEGYEPEDAQEEADAGHVSGWVVLSLQAYIHGGVHLSLGSFGCPWDSGQVGWVFVKEEHGWGEIDGKPVTHEQIAEWLVEEWNQCLSGDVWVVDIENGDGEILDSYGGVYGIANALEIGKNDSVASMGEQTKLVSVKVLYKDGTWTLEQAPVPLAIGNSEVPGWLLEHWYPVTTRDGTKPVDSIVFVREINTERGAA